MITHILKKDWKLLWPLVVMVAAIQIGREWAGFHIGLLPEVPAAEELLEPLTLAWFIGIAALSAAVVHQDAVPGVDQDWLIRPLRRSDLLLAKLAFLALTISVPMFALNLTSALAMGMPLAASLHAVLFKELFIFACFIAPVAALASTTRNMTELIGLGAALVVVYSLSLVLAAFFFGSDWCPTCHTGMAWLQHLNQHLGILLGAALILFLEYYQRRSTLARALAVIGALALVFLQLSWSRAFAIEQWLSGPSNGAAAVALAFGGDPAGTNTASPRGGALNAGQTTQWLLHGHVDQAVDYLHRRARRDDAPVSIDLPVRTVGVAADELLLVDRSQARLVGENGRVLYRGPPSAQSPGLLEDTASGLTYQRLELPSEVYRQAAASTVRLEMDVTLTLVKVKAEHRIAVRDGELRLADLGVCTTKLERNTVSLLCKTIEQPPFCFSATLYTPDGRHNPEVFHCDPDYRRHWPALIDVLNFYGIDVPVRDRYGVIHYELDASDLGTAVMLLKIYGERDHFQRTLAVAAFEPERWRDRQ